MEDWDKLAYDHEQTLKYFHALADTRFKLLAFVPLVTGGAVVALSPATSPLQSGLLGIFGFLVTLGITFYDRRNTQIYDAISARAKSLEALMALPRLGNTRFRRSGPLLHRPERTLKLFGVWKMWHDRGLGIICSTALAAWAYLAVSGLTHYLGVAAKYQHLLQGGIPLLVWVLFLLDYHRCDTATDPAKALPAQIEKLVMRPARAPLGRRRRCLASHAFALHGENGEVRVGITGGGGVRVTDEAHSLGAALKAATLHFYSAR